MKLTLGDISLRPFEPANADCIYEWYYSGEYEDYFRYAKSLYKRQHFVDYEFIMRNTVLMIYVKGWEKPIGMWEYSEHIPSEQAKIGVMIEKGFQRRGYASISAYMFFSHLFGDLNLKRVIICVLESSPRLMELASKLGEPMGLGDYPGEKRFILTRERFDEIQEGLLLGKKTEIREYTDRR